jgi:hypothetical protein
MTAVATSNLSARVSRLGVGQTTVVQIGAALIALAVMLFAPQVLNDGDTYWHLAAGEWMRAHGQVLHQDVFSLTFSGRPWVAHEWLSEVLMALAFHAGGWGGLLALYAATTAIAAAIFAGALGRSLRGVTLIATLVLAFGCVAPALLIRPHVLVLPILLLWTVELLAARDAGRAPRPFMAGLMLLWANLHGSYVFGFVLLAPLALEALVAPQADRAKVIRDWGGIGLLCAGATLVTPLGLTGLMYPVYILGMGTLNAIQEWRPADFAEVGPFELALLATTFVCLSRGVRVPPLRLALLVLLLHMTLQHQRHLTVLAVVAPLLLAKPLANALHQRPTLPRRSPAAWVAFAIAAAVLVGVRLAIPVVRHDGPTSPIAALDHVPPALAQRPMLNTYGFGGYLIYRGVKPFIDGRADMYGDDYFNRDLRIMDGDTRSLDRALVQYGIDWTLLAPDERLVKVLDVKPGWRRLYSDKYAIVHVRAAVLEAGR